MTPQSRLRPQAVLLAALLPLTTSVCAQTTAADSELRVNGYTQVGVSRALLSDGNQNWNDQYLRAHWQYGATLGLNAEVSRQNHFGDRGVFVGAGFTRVFDERWYATAAAGTSSGGFFLPRFRTDVFLHRKLLPAANLDASVGLGYYRAKDGHQDNVLHLGAAYYFENAPVIAEGGLRFNRSNPGGVTANRAFGALTLGRHQHSQLTLRMEAGREAYQLLGSDKTISDFSSKEASVNWRHWITRDAGISLRAERYTNPSYNRRGGEFAVFADY